MSTLLPCGGTPSFRQAEPGPRRAKGGRLTRPPQSITLGEVVRALEQRQALVECFRKDGGDCVLKPRCRLKARLAAAREAFMRELDTTTLAECAYIGSSKGRPTPYAA